MCRQRIAGSTSGHVYLLVGIASVIQTVCVSVTFLRWSKCRQLDDPLINLLMLNINLIILNIVVQYSILAIATSTI